LRGRGDNRKKIHSIISDRVKYSGIQFNPWSQTRLRNTWSLTTG